MEEIHKFVFNGRQNWHTNLTWSELGTAQSGFFILESFSSESDFFKTFCWSQNAFMISQWNFLWEWDLCDIWNDMTYDIWYDIWYMIWYMIYDMMFSTWLGREGERDNGPIRPAILQLKITLPPYLPTYPASPCPSLPPYLEFDDWLASYQPVLQGYSFNPYIWQNPSWP